MEIVLKNKYYSFVKYWLITLLIFLLLIVIVGGLTRLTDSGLSITRWDVVSGIFPPMNLKEWENAFNLYKEIPQFYLVNPNITLNEFKIIYYWEYIHRLLARFFALLFLIPFIFFFLKKALSKEYNLNFFILFCLILLQGLMGWVMVKSGLTENITVSHFRLAIHLNLALILFASIFWYLLNLINKKNNYFFSLSNNGFVQFFVLLIFFQITLGAFTSGLDAGKIYQSWPSMNNNFLPDDVDLKSINMFDVFSYPSLVQFLHRNLAYIILVYIFVLFFYFYLKKSEHLYFPIYLVLFMTLIQIVLGIITLVSGLNIFYASMHQVSSVLLLTSSIYLSYKSVLT